MGRLSKSTPEAENGGGALYSMSDYKTPITLFSKYTSEAIILYFSSTITITMFTFTSSLIFSLLLLTTTNAQPYKPTDYFLLHCGSSSTSTYDHRKWDGDFEFITTTTASFSSTPHYRHSSVPLIPYSTARIFNASSFTYTVPVISQGPKFLRLYFYPANYSDLHADQSFFSVSSNGYSLLTNFSAFLTASYLANIRSGGPYFFKEFIIYVKDTSILNLTFTPSPNSYAFVNGIEILSLPENLYFHANKLKYVGLTTGPMIADDMALENIYRLNVGGQQISVNNDTGMYRTWDQDDVYIYGGAIGLTPVANNTIPITYTMETPNYTAPELVYRTQRSMGKLSGLYNLTWRLPVDSGFYYLLRLHFCNIIPQYTKREDVIFRVFINNQTAEEEADLFYWTQGTGYPVFKDYVVFVIDPDGRKSKQDLWLAMHPNQASRAYGDGYLNGLEAFKLSMGGNLSSPNPEISPAPPHPIPVSPLRAGNRKTPPYAGVIGGIGGGLVLCSVLVLIVLRRQRRVRYYDNTDDKSSTSLPSDRCRRFSLTEVKAATGEFNDNCIIGKGGFGKVYKGYMDNGKTTVAIKRLNPSSSQGFREFHTEIGMLSKLRHVHLVSLIGYCDDDGEMVLVYDYLAHGTLREHLYKTDNPHLSWKRRLHICIGTAQGLHYLHTGGSRRIIHRDVKSTNILLDENWVVSGIWTAVKGSVGYLDPEYCQRKQLTDKSDVYSFGVVLLEVLCSRPVIVPWLTNKEVSLAEWGKFCYRRGTLHDIIDPKLIGDIAGGCLRKFGEVANSCLHEEGSQRPTMEDVVWGLELALKLQVAAEKMGGTSAEAMPENQELPFLMQPEPTTTG